MPSRKTRSFLSNNLRKTKKLINRKNAKPISVDQIKAMDSIATSSIQDYKHRYSDVKGSGKNEEKSPPVSDSQSGRSKKHEKDEKSLFEEWTSILTMLMKVCTLHFIYFKVKLTIPTPRVQGCVMCSQPCKDFFACSTCHLFSCCLVCLNTSHFSVSLKTHDLFKFEGEDWKEWRILDYRIIINRECIHWVERKSELVTGTGSLRLIYEYPLCSHKKCLEIFFKNIFRNGIFPGSPCLSSHPGN